MGPSVDVVIATYGDEEYWAALAERAYLSAEKQSVPPNRVWYSHDVNGSDICKARNATAQRSDADWLIFLDADDELDELYIESMLCASGDLRWPSTLGIVDGVEDPFAVLGEPRSHILYGNHMVIGTMVRRELFNVAGGFRPGLPCLEDWDLWIRCILAHGVAEPCPKAIYKVHVRTGSRNTDIGLHAQVYTEIQRRYWGLAGMYGTHPSERMGRSRPFVTDVPVTTIRTPPPQRPRVVPWWTG